MNTTTTRPHAAGYFAELISLGGIQVTRRQAIIELLRAARETGRERPEEFVARWLMGYERGQAVQLKLNHERP